MFNKNYLFMDKQLAFKISNVSIDEMQPNDSINVDFEKNEYTITIGESVQQNKIGQEDLDKYSSDLEYKKEPEINQEDILTIISIVVTVIGIIVSCVGFVWQGQKKCKQMRRVTRHKQITKYSNGTSSVEIIEDEEYWDECN